MKGDVIGGDGEASGRVVSKTSIDQVVVKGSVFGGDGGRSGAVGALGSLALVRIEGDLLGGFGFKSGGVASKAQLPSVVIGTTNAGSAFTGLISSPAIGAVTVNGSIFSRLSAPAAIRATTIGSIAVTGDIDGFGGVGFQTAGGVSGPTGVEIEARTSIGSITVGGFVNRLSVFVGGGFDAVEVPPNPDAQIGTIRVGGTWDAGSVAVGVLAGSDGIFGTRDDKLPGGGDASVFSGIARIVIGGALDSTAASASGFIAEQIGALSVNGGSVPLTAGPRNDTKYFQVTGSAFVRENNAPLT